MNILVIDDSIIHQQSARQTLVGHNLTIATSYEQGLKLLAPIEDSTVMLGEKGMKFDVVLSDLLMPASSMMLNREAIKVHAGVEEALGWALVLRAVLNETRYAALVSDVGHHNHPAAYALDAIDNADDSWGDTKFERGLPRKKAQFIMNGAKVGIFHSPSCFIEGTSCRQLNCNKGRDPQSDVCFRCDGTGLDYGKDWGRVLQCLLED
jgi:CheY-like chemotaxis protein